MSPPLPNELLPGGIFCRTLIDYLFTTKAMRGNFNFFEKTSPPFLARCCLRWVLFFLLFGSRDWCRGVWLKNVSPLFGIHVSIVTKAFFFSRSFFCSVRLKSRNPPFLPKVICFEPFERSKSLGVFLHTFVTLLPKVFWFGPLKGRSPLAFFLHLFCRRFFGSDLEKVEAP